MSTKPIIQRQRHLQISDRLPLLTALLCALILHALLFLLPLSMSTEPVPHRGPMAITLMHGSKPSPPSGANPSKGQAPKESSRKSASALTTSGDQKKIVTREQRAPALTPTLTTTTFEPTTKASPELSKSLAPDNSETTNQQNARGHEQTGGAKSRSTVFDTRLAGRLRRERNKVPIFTAHKVEFMTATGTYIQHGDRCVEVKKLILSDIDSNLSQPFKVKCTKRLRPKEDTDRLARKYGIP